LNKYKKTVLIFIVILVLVTGFVLYSPRMLLYSSGYEKADAIVLLLGPDFKARQKEASDLISEGMVDFLIIPAYHRAYRVYNKGENRELLPDLYSSQADKKASNYPNYYEDTHLELIDAERVMTSYGLRSAIFVSSPYHMRRIKIIALKIFDKNKGNFYFVPTKYEKAPADFWELSSSDWRKVRREYSKILWFLIYFTLSV